VSRHRAPSPIFIGLCLCLLSAAHPVSAKPPDETVAPRITVVFENGDTLRALSVEPAGVGMVRITDADRQARFRPLNRVRRVLDETGRDRTVEALDRGQVIGSPPQVTVPGERSHEVPRPPRYGPRSVVRSFSITETSVFGRVYKTRDRDERTFTISFDCGREFNVSARSALGATAFVGAGDGSADLGARLHYRRWLTARSSLDFAPGVIFAHEEPGRATGQGPGLVGQIAWSDSRYVSLAAQVYSVERSAFFEYGPYGSSSWIPGSRDTGVMVGFKVGGTPGLMTGAAGAVVGFIIAANQPHYQPSTLGF
jgi:hypothetical protein